MDTERSIPAKLSQQKQHNRSVNKMDAKDFIKSIGGKPQSEAKEVVLQLFSEMPPDRFFEHMTNMQELARQSGQVSEREEIVCRLLASGMPVDEIAVILCKRTDEIRIIGSNNAATTIPKYAKKLKERRRRREQQSAK